MKLNKFFMGVLGAFALTACSSEEMIPDKPGPVDEGKSRFMKVSIRNAFASTRAEKDFEDGFDQENKVKNIIFYFFDKDGNAINVVNGDKNYFICEGPTKKDENNEDIKDENDNPIKEDIPGSISGPNENIEKILNTTIVLSNGNSQKDNLKDLYSMVAILNYDGFITPKNMSLEGLEKEAGNYAQNLATKKSLIEGDKNSPQLMVPNEYRNASTGMPYFVMTSSSYLAEEQQSDGSYQKVPTFLVKNIASHVRDSDKEASENPVDIYVERLVAKVRLSTAWTRDVTTQSVKYDGKDCEAILLKDNKGNNLTTADGKQIYVIFEGWGLHGTAQNSWLFKQVGASWDFEGWGDGTAWNDKAYFRSYWALNHPSVTPGTLMHFPYEYATGVIGTDTTEGSFFYCLENAGDDEASGLKKLDGYNPDDAISPRTQVFIKAKLVVIGENGAETLKLAEWGGSKYTQESVVTAMLGTVNNDIFIRKVDKKETLEDGTVKTVYSYISIPQDMVNLISGVEYGNSFDAENNKRYLSYLRLKNELDFPEGYEKAFFKDMIGTRFGSVAEDADEQTALKADVEKVNELLRNIIGAKVWEDGKSYYYTDLKHLGTKEQNGLYGVVRNHIYDVKINTITGLGTPVLNPSDGTQEIIIPQHPKTDAFFLGARINILSWRVVNNNTSLDW